jgi:hypothetical protein
MYMHGVCHDFLYSFNLKDIYCVFIFTHLGPVVDEAYFLNIMHIFGFGTIFDISLRTTLMPL